MDKERVKSDERKEKEELKGIIIADPRPVPPPLLSPLGKTSPSLFRG